MFCKCNCVTFDSRTQCKRLRSMKNKYIDLVEQTFDFPQDEFKLDENNNLKFHDISLMDLVKQYGTPLNSPICQRFLTTLNVQKNGST